MVINVQNVQNQIDLKLLSFVTWTSMKILQLLQSHIYISCLFEENKIKSCSWLVVQCVF